MALQDHYGEIAVGIVGFIGTIIAYFTKGRQQNKNEKVDSITSGTDKIVETSNKLLERFEELLNSEQKHRKACEESLRNHKKMIDDTNKKVRVLENKIKHYSKNDTKRTD